MAENNFHSGMRGVNAKTKVRTLSDPEKMLEAADLMDEIADAAREAVDSGKSFASVCRDHDLDARRVRLVLGSENLINSKIREQLDKLDLEPDGYEKFYDDLFKYTNPEYQLPFDYEESVETVLDGLNEREETILRLLYGIGEPKTKMADVAREFDVSRERIRQIKEKSMRKMKAMPNFAILKKGYTQYQIDKKLLYEKNKARRNEMLEEQGLRQTENGELEIVDLSKLPIENLNLSVRSYNCLKRAGVDTVSDLLGKSMDDLWKIRNLGAKSVQEIWSCIERIKNNEIL